MHLQLLDLLLFLEWVPHHVDSTWNVWICDSCKEGFAAVDKSDLCVLEASFVLRTRPTVHKLSNGAVLARGVNEYFVRRSCGLAVGVSIFAFFSLSLKLLGVPR